MDRSVDNYLHKKFKKQLSIEPRAQAHHQRNDKENKISARVLEPCEEKTSVRSPDLHRSSPVKDNNRSSPVPNQYSTNNNQNHINHHIHNNNNNSLVTVMVTPVPDLSKSSISTSESGNSKPCISVAPQENWIRCVSFDKTFSPNESTKISSTSSSLFTNVTEYAPCYPQQLTSPPPQDDASTKEDGDSLAPKSDQYKEEAQPTPEKNPSGKYVCNYCNLVCSKPSVLQKHIRAHTNERPYPCTSCGFSFKTRSNLYKHCRSRTHANRVMGVKAQENTEGDGRQNYTDNATQTQTSNDEGFEGTRNKPYKPRFHTVNQQQFEGSEDDRGFSGADLSHHINEIINKNNSIVNSSDSSLLKRRYSEALSENSDYQQRGQPYSPTYVESKSDEPLNLTNKNRKRCMSEATEPVMQKSLIKELLLKNLYSDMQCPHCKMIFQTVTELELHKLRSCKGKPSEAKYTRSSSVNVASILTKNKNAFDNIPQFQNAVFPLNSPGPFLGKTRLVDGDKNKSFSFDAVNLPLASPSESSPNYVLSPIPFKEEKKTPVKLFGGEVKVHNSSGESKSFRIDGKEDKTQSESSFTDYDGKLIENRLVKSSLQSGGTVLTTKTSKEEPTVFRDVIRVYENTSGSPNIDISNLTKPHFSYEPRLEEDYSPHLDPPSASRVSISLKNDLSSPQNYTNITDFSQNAVKLLTPNLKHPTIQISGMLSQNNNSLYPVALSPSTLTRQKMKSDREFPTSQVSSNSLHISVMHDNELAMRSLFQPVKRSVIQKHADYATTNNIYNPMNLLVNGKVIRYVPGMPGPVTAEGVGDVMYESNIVAVTPAQRLTPKAPPSLIESPRTSPIIQRTVTPIVKSDNSKVLESSVAIDVPPEKAPKPPAEVTTTTSSEPKKFIRPNSLALKPAPASLKQHHGLTPTIFNQILISPDTPRVAKKYAQHLFNGNYFSYLGLKSSTKPVYCTLNKTQPFYVPHFKKLSMYSEWRQQDTKVDKLYVSSYDSRQRNQRYTTAGKPPADLIIHSSYKFVLSELPNKSEKDDDNQKSGLIGGYECNEDSTYIRGRGRGRYVCEQCGIRCKKPSMLKKHIRTHSNDRPYTCSHCNFSFKTKGNLTKHMKSKSHTKNYTATSSRSGSSTRLSGSQSSESDTDDSGMDSSDESMTRQQEHEAAYGLLSLSQKTSVSASPTEILSPSGIIRTGSPASPTDQFMTTEQIAYVSKTNYAKNKILDNFKYKPNRQIAENFPSTDEQSREDKKLTSYLGKTSSTRPLTYPYTSVLNGHEPFADESKLVQPPNDQNSPTPEPKSIRQFHVIQKYAKSSLEQEPTQEIVRNNNVQYLPSPVPTLKVNDVVVQEGPMERKRKITVIENNYRPKVHRNDEVIDLSVTSSEKRDAGSIPRLTIDRHFTYDHPRINEEPYPETTQYGRSPDYHSANDSDKNLVKTYRNLDQHRIFEENHHTEIRSTSYSLANNMDKTTTTTEKLNNYRNLELNRKLPPGPVLMSNPVQQPEASYNNQDVELHSNSSSDTRTMEYDNSAMETLADVATKQVKLDKNMLAKSVASEYLKLMTQNENPDGSRESVNSFIPGKDAAMNELMVKSEGNKSCTVCSKSFNKPFQLRLHMNIHYLERPFRCDSCSVSFRTKGHLQKHERSASHYSKLSSSPAQSSSEPRPFKCSDCSIAFRIHGHLAKHLRSKMHIMKLECLAKIPFGLYAELERSNSLLTEINTSDGDQCLESLKTLARKVFINDPGKLQTLVADPKDPDR